jgi:predicted secreted hydrolase
MRRTRVLSVGALLLFTGCNTAPPSGGDSAPTASGLRYLSAGDDGGFSRALVPREFAFPADHGSHPDFRTEWWYFTGNLTADGGRHFGFELTFFRYGLAPPARNRGSGSEWRAEQVFLAHMALTDTAGQRFSAHERVEREALGLAGATAEPLKIWVGDWSAQGEALGEGLTLRLAAEAEDVGFALEVRSTRGPVRQGDRGLDRKGEAPGNASYYYSMPALTTTGEVRVGGARWAVAGQSWMDREWGTSALEAGVVGWDWFSLELGDSGSLMFYRLRRADGTASPFSGGTLAKPDGTTVRLGAADVVLEPKRRWTSGKTGVVYPIEWRLRVPSLGLALEVEPYLDEQELDLSVRYWEGAVRVSGSRSGEDIAGRGYVELAGY